MTENNDAENAALLLNELVAVDAFEEVDMPLVERCLRVLTQPLRVIVFGTDTKHAMALINLMVGKSLLPTSLARANIRLAHGDVTQAQVQFEDGRKGRVEENEFKGVLEQHPARTRITADLSVLNVLSILAITNKKPDELRADVEQSLPSADIAIWAGVEPDEPLLDLWQDAPEGLRDHGYLMLSQKMERHLWDGLEDDFVDVIQVDPRRAQEAKLRPGGVDKAVFKEAGGTAVVRALKREIDTLIQTALDGTELLLARYGISADGEGEDAAEAANSKLPPLQLTDEVPSPEPVENRVHSDETAKAINRVLSRPVRERVYSIPLGKVATRSRGLLY
ncbi:MAG: hypothetical protein AAF762_01575 [Pseudomonadota bacterium]